MATTLKPEMEARTADLAKRLGFAGPDALDLARQGHADGLYTDAIKGGRSVGMAATAKVDPRDRSRFLRGLYVEAAAPTVSMINRVTV